MLLLTRRVRNERKQKVLGIAAHAWVSHGFQCSYISFRLGETYKELHRDREYYVEVYDVSLVFYVRLLLERCLTLLHGAEPFLRS